VAFRKVYEFDKSSREDLDASKRPPSECVLVPAISNYNIPSCKRAPGVVLVVLAPRELPAQHTLHLPRGQQSFEHAASVLLDVTKMTLPSHNGGRFPVLAPQTYERASYRYLDSASASVGICSSRQRGWCLVIFRGLKEESLDTFRERWRESVFSSNIERCRVALLSEKSLIDRPVDISYW
jgi:hypothetical protein